MLQTTLRIMLGPIYMHCRSFTYQSSRVSDHGSLALVFGWWNASSHHLQKYLNLYHELGVSTLSTTLSPHYTMMPLLIPRVISKLKLTLMQYIDLHSPQRIVVHTFSNNGAYCYAMIHQALVSHQIPNIVCVVHDSGPTFLTAQQLLLGLKAGISVTHNSTLSNLSSSFFLHLLQRYLNLSSNKRILASVNNALCNMPKVPTLMIAGRDDAVLPPEDIVKCVQCAGIKVLEKDWWWVSGTDHVAHLQRYEKEYYGRINDFLYKHNVITSNKMLNNS